jgi:hypothetical protein
MPKEIFVINYEAAYTISMGFLYMTMLAEYVISGQRECVDALAKQGTLMVPETSDGHDEYHEGRIHSIALNDMYGNTFDLLSYSGLMFWVEHYNRQLIEQAIVVGEMSSREKDAWNEKS